MKKTARNKELAEDLKAQMLAKEQLKQKEKDDVKNQDYKNMYEYIHHNPFGRMGAGAPIRDAHGQVVANRIKVFDEAAVNTFHKSLYKPEQEMQQAKIDFNEPQRRKQNIQNLNEVEIGLQFLEWGNQEKLRKEKQKEEWKNYLDEQSNFHKYKKEEEKRRKFEEDLMLEQKIK